MRMVMEIKVKKHNGGWNWFMLLFCPCKAKQKGRTEAGAASPQPDSQETGLQGTQQAANFLISQKRKLRAGKAKVMYVQGSA